MNSPHDLAPLVFPYHLGPGIRPFTTSLLYHGGLTLTMPGWISGEPLKHFYAVCRRAAETGHPLESVFGTAAHFFHLAQSQALERRESLAPLETRVRTVQLVYPGTRDAYAKWKPKHESILPIAAVALQEPLNVTAAATDFVWRVYELSLEVDGDYDEVLNCLAEAAAALPAAEWLLAECFVNRLNAASTGLPFVVDSPVCLTLLNQLADQPPEGVSLDRLSVDQATFAIFDQLLWDYTPRLDPPHMTAVNAILEKRTSELASMRKKCAAEAQALCSLATPVGVRHVRVIVDRLEEEVKAIANLDSKNWDNLKQNVLGESGTWMAIAGAAAAGLGNPVLGSTLALTALTSLGAAAFRTRAEFQRALKDSPWALVYYLNRTRYHTR